MTLTLERVTPAEGLAIMNDPRAYAPVREDGLDASLRQLNAADTNIAAGGRLNKGVMFAHVLAMYGWKAVPSCL
jgi:hypothetical protein